MKVFLFKNYWKIITVLLLVYVLLAGLLMPVPRREILNETIRNLYFHVPMWFGMIALTAWSFVQSIVYLNTQQMNADAKAVAFAKVGLVYGVLGLATGAVWAKYTWGSYWSQDIKQITSAIVVLMYAAYVVLRDSLDDPRRKATVAAVYNIFSFVLIYPLLFKIPRMVQSLHPGNGGNPALGDDSLADMMKPIFYPSVIGFVMLGVWVSTLLFRFYKIENKLKAQL
jgi:heme exporter protein C